MSLKDEFKKMVNELTTKFTIPSIANIFFPPFYKGGQPKDAQFMAVSLEDGASALFSCLMKKWRNTLPYNRQHLLRKTRGDLRLNLAVTIRLKR
jgi:hypothetical protein